MWGAVMIHPSALRSDVRSKAVATCLSSTWQAKVFEESSFFTFKGGGTSQGPECRRRRHNRTVGGGEGEGRDNRKSLDLLGFRFAPRIRDLGDKRLYSIDKPSANLPPLTGGFLLMSDV